MFKEEKFASALTVSGRTYKSVTCSPACVLGHFSHVWLCVTPRTVVCQAPLSMGFSRQELLEWTAISFSTGFFQPRDQIHVSYLLHWQADSLPLTPPGRSCGNLVPRPDIEQRPLAVKAYSPNHWPTREFPNNG